MKVTYLGTTVLLFDDGKDQIMFDAHVTRPSMLKFAFGKISTDRHMADSLIERFGISRLKAIFISHTHHDHVMDSPYFSECCGADIYGSPSALNVARGGNVPEERLHSYEEQSSYGIGNYEITVIPSKHSKTSWYNDDLGETIDAPLIQPAGRKEYKEGGSFDFLVRNGGRTYLIRPSFNYVEGQLDGIAADTLFLGTAGLAKADEETRERFFAETIDKVRPDLVIPIHWDNFFRSLSRPPKGMPFFIENTEKSLSILKTECRKRGVKFFVQKPLETLEI